MVELGPGWKEWIVSPELMCTVLNELEEQQVRRILIVTRETYPNGLVRYYTVYYIREKPPQW